MKFRLLHLWVRHTYVWVSLEEVDENVSRVVLQCSMCGRVCTVTKDEREPVAGGVLVG